MKQSSTMILSIAIGFFGLALIYNACSEKGVSNPTTPASSSSSSSVSGTGGNSCPNGQVVVGINSNGSLNCKDLSLIFLNLSNPSRYAVTNNTFQTPAPYKLCIMVREYVGTGGACQLDRNPDSTWKLACGGVTQSITVTNPNGGYPINYSGNNGGSSDGAIYCYN